MLESARLLLRPWALSPDSSPSDGSGLALTWTRIIADLETGARLGCVRVHSAAFFSWLPWLALPHLAVYETDDLSLLCTVRRGWGAARWQVLDADGRLVGTIHGDRIYDAFGRWVLVADPERGAARRVRTLDGRELGMLDRQADGMVVRFADDLVNDPLGKMLILATGLAQEAIPR
jgi:hypothetical protein